MIIIPAFYDINETLKLYNKIYNVIFMYNIRPVIVVF